MAQTDDAFPIISSPDLARVLDLDGNEIIVGQRAPGA